MLNEWMDGWLDGWMNGLSEQEVETDIHGY